jgi:hypothetical protein
MFRNLTRWAGYALLGAAMAMGLVDGVRSISASTLDMTELGALAFRLFPRHFPILEPAITRHVHPFLWDPIVLNLLLLPASLVLFVLGGLLMALGRPKPPAAIGS